MTERDANWGREGAQPQVGQLPLLLLQGGRQRLGVVDQSSVDDIFGVDLSEFDHFVVGAQRLRRCDARTGRCGVGVGHRAHGAPEGDERAIMGLLCGTNERGERSAGSCKDVCGSFSP